MLALSARIQTLLRGHKYRGQTLFGGCALDVEGKLLFIVGVIWGIAGRFWLSVELFFEGLTRIIVVVC